MKDKTTSDTTMRSPFVFQMPQDGTERLSLLKPPKSIALRSGLVVLKRGESVGLHNTDHGEEFLVILDGSGVLETNGRMHSALGKGCVAYIPPHTPHNITNSESEILRYLYVVSPVE
jgi:quercetin dioxygenase-like cupin family protein